MKNYKVGLIVGLIFSFFQIHAQTIIWGGSDDPNGSFDGGLNDWTSIPVSAATNVQNANWEWAPMGAFADTGLFDVGLPILSESAANGAAGFNSDYLDSGGLPDTFGTGPAAAPQESYLLSPAISTLGEDEVYLKFNSYYRGYSAKTKISVFTDGKAMPDTLIKLYSTRFDGDFNEYHFYANFENSATVRNHTELFNISAVAVNKAEVRLRFEWEGGYYFWLIDDVMLTTKPQNDLAIVDGVFPLKNGRTPTCFIPYDTLQFAMEALNYGSEIQTNVFGVISVFKEVENNDDELVYADTTNFGSIDIGNDTNRLTFNKRWSPNIGEGTYYLVYSIYSDDKNDFNESDNETRKFAYYFAVEDEVLDKFAPSSPSYSVYYPGAPYKGTDGISRWTIVNEYRMDDAISSCSGGNDLIYIDSIRHGHVASMKDSNATVVFGIFEVDICKIDEDYESLFSSYQNTDLVSLFFDSFAVRPLYYEKHVLKDGDFTTHKYPIMNNQVIELEPGVRYWITATYSGTDLNENSLRYSLLQDHVLKKPTAPSAESLVFLGGSWYKSQKMYLLGLDLDITQLVINTVDFSLDEQSFLLLPNLIHIQDLSIQFNFRTPTTGHITVYDQGGRVLYMREHKDLTNDTVSISTSQMNPGTYFVLFQSEDGFLTKKFVVSK